MHPLITRAFHVAWRWAAGPVERFCYIIIIIIIIWKGKRRFSPA
jgi:hypothetical protein